MTKQQQSAIILDYHKWLLRMESRHKIMDVDIQNVIRRYENRKERLLKKILKEIEEDKQ